jgi:hypothetical protein
VKLLLRILWLLLGLLYRLVVLVLFERWIPFPERPATEAPKAQAPRARGKPRREASTHAGRRAFEREPPLGVPVARAPRPPIFELRGGEPAPELVAALESEHLDVRARHSPARPPARRPSGARPLRALLRDKRALAGAIVLGEAFARRPPK